MLNFCDGHIGSNFNWNTIQIYNNLSLYKIFIYLSLNSGKLLEHETDTATRSMSQFQEI